MNLQIVILFFVTAVIERALANNCGTTTSWQEGNNATITYTPDPKYSKHSRTWLHSFGYFEPYPPAVIVFKSSGTAPGSTRYVEEANISTYMLKIHDVTIYDSGLYSVLCYTDAWRTIYSDSTNLQINIVPTTTASSYNPPTKQVSTQSTSVRRPTNQQTDTVTKLHIQTEESSRNKENDDDALLAPLIGGVVGTVAVVIACAVFLIVYHKRCKKQELKPPAQSKAKESITAQLLGENGNAEMTLSTEEIPEYASVIPKDQRKGAETIADGSDECPEYSKAVPKSERTADAKNDIQPKSICDTTEAETQLVYAELDLEHPKANAKDPEQHKDPDHVQVDLSKTGSSHDSKQVAEQLEQTEYVTIDFSKTE